MPRGCWWQLLSTTLLESEGGNKSKQIVAADGAKRARFRVGSIDAGDAKSAGGRVSCSSRSATTYSTAAAETLPRHSDAEIVSTHDDDGA